MFYLKLELSGNMRDSMSSIKAYIKIFTALRHYEVPGVELFVVKLFTRTHVLRVKDRHFE